MAIEYKGYRIATWIDDDTSHAQMLKGKKGDRSVSMST